MLRSFCKEGWFFAAYKEFKIKLLESHKPSTVIFLTLLFATTILLYLLTFNLMQRSLWADESMLLANFFDEEGFNILQPLKLYDQASPPLANLLLKLFVSLFNTVTAIRYSILTTFFLGLTYAIFGAYKTFGLKAAVLILLLSASSFNILFYSTEIKHYAFEITGTYIIIGWFLFYLNRKIKNLKLTDIIILLIGLGLGFSTLFVLASIIILVTYFTFINKKSKFIDFFIIAILFLIVLMYKYLSLHYAVYQINNYYDVYSKAIGIKNIIKSYNLADITTKISLIFSTIYFLMYFFIKKFILKNYHQLDNYNAVWCFYLIIITLVCLACAAGFYPINAPNKLAWLTPIMISFLSVAISLNIKNKYYSLFGFLVVVTFLTLFSFKSYQFKERTENNALYYKLSQLPPGHVLVYFDAQPSLEIYKKIIPELHKHTYLGIINNRSGDLIIKDEYIKNFADHITSTPGAWGSMTHFRADKNYDIYTNWIVNKNQDINSFYILFSHINEMLRDSFVKSLNQRGCKYSQLFSGRKVEILTADCPENTAYNLTDNNWINGVGINLTGFMVSNSLANIDKYQVGNFVRFSNGDNRQIIRVQQVQKYLNIFANGEPLNGKQIGFPNTIEVLK